jgi:hypothetical protein
MVFKAEIGRLSVIENMERETGVEPATSSLGAGFRDKKRTLPAKRAGVMAFGFVRITLPRRQLYGFSHSTCDRTHKIAAWMHKLAAAGPAKATSSGRTEAATDQELNA